MPKLKKHRPEKKPRFFKAERPRGRPPVEAARLSKKSDYSQPFFLVERKASENCFCFQHKNNRGGGSWPITITEATQILIPFGYSGNKNPGLL